MSAIQPNRLSVNEYGIWGDRSKTATAASVGCSGAVGGALSLGANALLTPNDWQGGLVTMGTTILASAVGACAGRLFDKVEESNNQSLKTVARTVGGVAGGAGLLFSLSNTINILYTGDVMSVHHQLGFSLIGAVAGGILGKYVKRWGSGLANVGASASLTCSLGVAASYVMPRYIELIPIPMLLSFSSLVCHPFKAKVS